jgi:hypothetical protein
MLDNIVDALERLLNDRPDVDNLLQEGVGSFHVATQKEIDEQIATGAVSEIHES